MHTHTLAHRYNHTRTNINVCVSVYVWTSLFACVAYINAKTSTYTLDIYMHIYVNPSLLQYLVLI